MAWWDDDYEYGDYPRGSYNSYLEWLADDNFVGMPSLGTVTEKKKEKKKEPAPAPAPKPKPAPAPTPKVDKVEQTYLKQIKQLEDQIKAIQKTPPKPTLPPPKPPTTPYSVGTTPISLSNPYQRKTMGGIGQFKSRTSQGMATIKSGLVNI